MATAAAMPPPPPPPRIKREADEVQREAQPPPPVAKRVKPEVKQEVKPEQQPEETHVIFAIDQSGSMRENDVRSDEEHRITRWRAVFDCVGEFVHEQASGSGSDLNFSLILWNERVDTVFTRMPLGDGNAVAAALDAARDGRRPKDGTHFSAAFKEARRISAGDRRVMLLFLSDGRPGDLQPRPPPDGAPIQDISSATRSPTPQQACTCKGCETLTGTTWCCTTSASTPTGSRGCRRSPSASAAPSTRRS